jgi:predicted SAM-dependent methyltransferase
MKDVDDRVDITNMSLYATGSIDCFICSHVLEHIPDDTKALQELFRILNLSGWGIVMAPLLPDLDKTYEDFSITTDEERRKFFGQEDHVRVYAKKEYINKLRHTGFIVHQLGVNDFGTDVLEMA